MFERKLLLVLLLGYIPDIFAAPSQVPMQAPELRTSPLLAW